MSTPMRGVAWAAGLVIVTLASGARAADRNVYVSAPLLLGADQHVKIDSTTSFAFGVRPELVVAFGSQHENAFGIGVYGDATKARSVSWVGGGLTAVAYRGALALAVSGGIDERFQDGSARAVPVVGAFFGLRLRADGLPLDLPFGARVDVRPGSGDVPTSLALQLQLDVLGAIGFFVNLAIDPTYGH